MRTEDRAQQTITAKHVVGSGLLLNEILTVVQMPLVSFGFGFVISSDLMMMGNNRCTNQTERSKSKSYFKHLIMC